MGVSPPDRRRGRDRGGDLLRDGNVAHRAGDNATAPIALRVPSSLLLRFPRYCCECQHDIWSCMHGASGADAVQATWDTWSPSRRRLSPAQLTASGVPATFSKGKARRRLGCSGWNCRGHHACVSETSGHTTPLAPPPFSASRVCAHIMHSTDACQQKPISTVAGLTPCVVHRTARGS